MRWNRRPDRHGVWTLHFALWPVKIGSQTIWLDTVERRCLLAAAYRKGERFPLSVWLFHRCNYEYRERTG